MATPPVSPSTVSPSPDHAVSQNDEAQGTIIVEWTPTSKTTLDAVRDNLEASGYCKPRVKKDGKIVYKSNSKHTWYPTVILDPVNGFVDLRRKRFAASPNGQISIVTKKLSHQATRRVLDQIEGPVHQWTDTLSKENLAEKLNLLPVELDHFWNGETYDVSVLGFEVSAHCLSPEERRGYVLHLWQTRIETEAGQLVRQVVETYMSQVIMDSDFPYTQEEINQANSNRQWGTPLSFNKG